MNVGIGPALNLTYTIDGHAAEGPEVRPGDILETKYPRERLDALSSTFEATYESLSGRKYRTRVEIGSREFIAFAKFDRL